MADKDKKKDVAIVTAPGGRVHTFQIGDTLEDVRNYWGVQGGFLRGHDKTRPTTLSQAGEYEFEIDPAQFSEWIRDLLRECVEPNPGPSLAEIVTGLKTKLGGDVAAFNTDLQQFEARIKAKYPDKRTWSDEHVRGYLRDHDDEVNGIFGGDSATIKKYLNELLPSGDKGDKDNSRGSKSDTKQVALTPNSKKSISQLTEAVGQLQIASSDAGAQTAAEWYDDHHTAAVLFWFDIRKHVADTALASWVLGNDASETHDVQPLWTNKIVTKLASLPRVKIQLVASPLAATIGTRKPDLPGYITAQPQNEYYLAVVGELKGGRVKDAFTSEEKGQMAGFLAKLLKITQRRFCFGFITDNRIIQFFRGEYENSSFKMQESFVAKLENDGWRQLIALLSQPASNLGVNYQTSLSLDTQPVTIDSYLGRGGFSVVYKGIYNNKQVVVKYLKDDKVDVAEREVDNLYHVRTLYPSVPRVVGVEDSNALILVLDSVGVPFGKTIKHARLQGDHICQLIDILHEAHKLLIVHRDIKLANIFVRLDDATKVLLNDWSLAAGVADEVSPAGTVLTMPSYLLCQSKHFRYHPLAGDDLESVVKLVHLSLFPPPSDPTDHPTVKAHWEMVFNLPFWKNLLEMAHKNDYEGLTTAVAEFYM